MEDLTNVTINGRMPEYFDLFLTEDDLLYRGSIPNAVVRWSNIDREHFCLDYEMTTDGKLMKVEPTFRMLYDQETDFNWNEYYVKAGALLVSCVFLIIVLLVYCVLPELRNLAGKVLMAYAGSLLCAYSLLATMIFIMIRAYDEEPVTTTFCVALSSAIYFFFMASFLWMNVMSWDLWRAFRRLVDFRQPQRSAHPSTFFLYSGYAWGVAFCMMLVFVLLNEYPMPPGVITPNIPLLGCFIDEPEKMIYFYVPMLILISCNWILFLLTAYNFWQYDKSKGVLNKRNSSAPAKNHATRQRFIMYLKFSLIMGISFILEATSSKAPTLSLWYITDMYNMLIGVAFFAIFVCKRRILRMLIRKFRLCCRKEGSNIGTRVNLQASKVYFSNGDITESPL
ncbi:unnamed protein product, partial [Iphiclides podalirius]